MNKKARLDIISIAILIIIILLVVWLIIRLIGG